MFKVKTGGKWLRFAGRQVAEEGSEAAYSMGRTLCGNKAFVVYAVTGPKRETRMAWSPKRLRYWP